MIIHSWSFWLLQGNEKKVAPLEADNDLTLLPEICKIRQVIITLQWLWSDFSLKISLV